MSSRRVSRLDMAVVVGWALVVIAAVFALFYGSAEAPGAARADPIPSPNAPRTAYSCCPGCDVLSVAHCERHDRDPRVRRRTARPGTARSERSRALGRSPATPGSDRRRSPAWPRFTGRRSRRPRGWVLSFARESSACPAHSELIQRCRSRVRTAAAIDDIRFGLHRALRKTRGDVQGRCQQRVAGVGENVSEGLGTPRRGHDLVAKAEGLLDDLAAEPARGSGDEPNRHGGTFFLEMRCTPDRRDGGKDARFAGRQRASPFVRPGGGSGADENRQGQARPFVARKSEIWSAIWTLLRSEKRKWVLPMMPISGR